MANKLKLDPNKMKMLLTVGRTDPGTELSPVLNRVALLIKEQICSLKVLLNLCLLFNKLVGVVTKSTVHQL